MGRSKGGLSTKIHTLTDQNTNPVQIVLTGGQSGDNPQLLPLVDTYRKRAGRIRHRITILADKAYSHPTTRQALRRRRITAAIPERSDQIARRKAKGSNGGRPPEFSPETYKLRNTVERGYARIKQFRAIATRYDKYATTYKGGFLLCSAILLSRH